MSASEKVCSTFLLICQLKSLMNGCALWWHFITVTLLKKEKLFFMVQLTNFPRTQHRQSIHLFTSWIAKVSNSSLPPPEERPNCPPITSKQVKVELIPWMTHCIKCINTLSQYKSVYAFDTICHSRYYWERVLMTYYQSCQTFYFYFITDCFIIKFLFLCPINCLSMLQWFISKGNLGGLELEIILNVVDNRFDVCDMLLYCASLQLQWKAMLV